MKETTKKKIRRKNDDFHKSMLGECAWVVTALVSISNVIANDVILPKNVNVWKNTNAANATSKFRRKIFLKKPLNVTIKWSVWHEEP